MCFVGMFTSEVQFGHAGSCANSDRETAVAKNNGLRAAGANVPTTFDNLGDCIHDVYNKLVEDGTIVPQPEVPPPTVPMDYSWARVSIFISRLSHTARSDSLALGAKRAIVLGGVIRNRFIGIIKLN